MRISDWSSDVCSSDLARSRLLLQVFQQLLTREFSCDAVYQVDKESPCILAAYHGVGALACEAIHRRIIVFSDVETCRSDEHTSELQSLMRISYAVFCLKKKIYTKK